MKSYPRACVSCRHWGANEPTANPYTATDRWRWCDAGQGKAWAHVMYVCAAHKRLPKWAIDERMARWGILPPEDENEAEAA